MPLYDIRCVLYPYCLERVEGIGYRVLNRDYKPVGIAYENYPIIQEKEITIKITEKLSWNNSDRIDKIYLYVNNPTVNAKKWNDYLKRLSILSKLGVKT